MKMAWNVLKCLDMAGMTERGWKWLDISGNDWKLLEMTVFVLNETEIVLNETVFVLNITGPQYDLVL